MDSMMAPSIALDDEGVVLAAGAAGGTRLRSALLRWLPGSSTRGSSRRRRCPARASIPSPRLVHLEPGFEPEVEDALTRRAGSARWPAPHHYFGGVSVVGRSGLPAIRGGAGSARCDPRSRGADRLQPRYVHAGQPGFATAVLRSRRRQ